MKCSRVVGLTPSVVCQKGVDHSQLQELVEMYHGDLPSLELVEQEVMRWSQKYKTLPDTDRPDTCAEAIRACDPIYFPNIFVLQARSQTLFWGWRWEASPEPRTSEEEQTRGGVFPPPPLSSKILGIWAHSRCYFLALRNINRGINRLEDSDIGEWNTSQHFYIL